MKDGEETSRSESGIGSSERETDRWAGTSISTNEKMDASSIRKGSIRSTESSYKKFASHVALQPRTCREYATFSILVLINLLNYMDRYTVAGVLTQIQDYYHINDAQAGLLQSVFMVTLLAFSPVCGYLGDRYNRKYIMVVGIAVWIMAVLASTFIPSDHFWAFCAMRGVVGVGEASYAVISPSLIADMFHGTLRSRMFMVFYFAIPVGSGLGYIVGSLVAGLTGSWEWGIRVTPILGVISLALIILFVHDCPRGQMEVNDPSRINGKTHYWDDLKRLMTNATYVTSTIAYTAVVFVVGTLAWWVPSAILYAEADRLGYDSTDDLPANESTRIFMVFGAITTVSGFVGVTIGTLGSNALRKGSGCLKPVKTPRSDAIMCAIGAIIGFPTLFAVIQLIPTSQLWAYICMFVCITGLCFNWAINVDLLMAVVPPSHRATANAVQISTSHLFGDGSGPYIIGAISDAIRGNDTSPHAHWESLADAFYIPNAVLIISVLLFIVAALTFPRDRRRFLQEMGHVKTSDSGEGHDNASFVVESTKI